MITLQGLAGWEDTAQGVAEIQAVGGEQLHYSSLALYTPLS